MRHPARPSSTPKLSSTMSWNSPGRAGEHGHRPGADAPGERERPEPAAHEAAREVLLGDADAAELPHLADPHEQRQQHVDDGALDRALGEGGVEHGVGPVLVEGRHGVEQLGDEHRRVGPQPGRRQPDTVRRRPRRRACRRTPRPDAASGAGPGAVTVVAAWGPAALGGEHPARGLGGADPLVAQGDDLTHPALVLVAVEPVAAGRAHRAQQAVAALPRPQDMGADAHLGGELANPHRRRYRTPHAATVDRGPHL